MRLKGKPEQPVLQGVVRGEFGHASAVHDASGVHHRDTVAKRAGRMEVLLHHQYGGAGLLQLGKRFDQVVDPAFLEIWAAA